MVAGATAISMLGAAGLLVVFGRDSYAADAVAAVALVPAVAYLAVALEPALVATVALMLTVFAGNWQYMHVPVPLDRLAWLGTLAGLGWRYLRGDPRFLRISVKPAHIVLLFAIAFAICSAAMSGTLTQSAGAVGILDDFGAVPFALFFLAPALYPTARKRNYLVIGLVTLGLYLGLIAWLEGTGHNSFVFPRYILNPNIGEHYGRARPVSRGSWGRLGPVRVRHGGIGRAPQLGISPGQSDCSTRLRAMCFGHTLHVDARSVAWCCVGDSRDFCGDAKSSSVPGARDGSSAFWRSSPTRVPTVGTQ